MRKLLGKLLKNESADPSPTAVASAEGYYQQGNALRSQGQLESAIASYTRAIQLKPDHAHAYCNRGVVELALGLTAEALSSYDHALALDPRDALTHYNRALLMQERRDWHEALASYDRAIALDPGYPEAQYNRALLLLFMGRFEAGWRAYEWRWKNASRLSIGALRNFMQPLWLGDAPLAGRRLLLHAEAGLGDTLQFCRYAASCAAQGATVYLEVQPPLRGLLSNLAGVSQSIAAGGPLPPFDLHCPLMSLPLAFKTTLDTIPALEPYLHADRARVADWQARLGARSRPRVGLVWSGNPDNTIDARRSIPLALCLQHLPTEFQYFCLQTQIRETDRAALGRFPPIARFDAGLMDFENTAALCECLDLVISVDTSIAHLCGALGRRTWVPLPLTPDWRWMDDREDTPWYPTMKLYRQDAAGDWASVLARIAADLRRELVDGRL
jgi:hypothetical protein